MTAFVEGTIRRRLEEIRRQLDERGADAFVAGAGPAMQYAAGAFGEPLDRHALLVVPATEEPWIVASEKAWYGIERDSPVENASVIPENDPTAVVRQLAADLDDDREQLLVDPHLPFCVVEPLTASRSDLTVESAAPLLRELRIRKDDVELDALRRSASVADRVSETVRELGEEAIGTTESELAAEIRGKLHAAGGTRLSFPPVVAAGENAAEPYHRNADREIRPGDPVILDFGAFVDGYAGDQTRTVVFGGEPPDEFREAHAAVLEALDAGVDAVRPGRTAEDVHRAVEDTLASHGLADRFLHGTGHGVGVEAHEAPTIGPGNGRELEPGMVFSIEPGVYVEGEFGVRIEDLVVVTEPGAERLNDSPRTWRALDG